jgi:proteasome lid subunit RPN8/RPN11
MRVFNSFLVFLHPQKKKHIKRMPATIAFDMRKVLGRLLGMDKYGFEKIIVERLVIDAISNFARGAHPKEFIMFLQGSFKEKALTITGLIFQEYYASEELAMPIIRLPISMGIVGSVHSHPGPSNKPSNADLEFFAKQGIVHLIIKRPYSEKDIAAYDANGKSISFEAA